MSRIKASEQFTMLGSPHRDNVFGDYGEQYSAKTSNPDVGITASIRHHHPDMTLTVTPTSYADLFGFAAAGTFTARNSKPASICKSRFRLWAISWAAFFQSGAGEAMWKSPGFFWLEPLARLKPDISLMRAQAAIQSFAHAAKPKSEKAIFRLSDGSQGANNDTEYSKPVTILMGVVALVLLIACANLAGLLLARANSRVEGIRGAVIFGRIALAFGSPAHGGESGDRSLRQCGGTVARLLDRPYAAGVPEHGTARQ